MTQVFDLPYDICYIISGYLDTRDDLLSWSRSCPHFSHLLAPILIRSARNDATAICRACEEGLVEIVKGLSKAGANFNVQRKQDATLRTRLWDTDAKEDRLQAEVSSLPWSPQTQEYASSQRKDVDDMAMWLRSHFFIRYKMVEFLEEYSDNIYTYDYEGFFGKSIRDEDAEPSCTSRPEGYWTPLHIAAARGNDELVSLLLDSGANINASSYLFCLCLNIRNLQATHLWTPLHTAMCHRRESTVKLLLSRGASTKVTNQGPGWNNRQFTALHSACTLGYLNAGRALIDGGYQTDMEVLDDRNMTPLAYAFFRGSWAMISFLLEHGADINAKFGPLNALGHACLLGYYTEAIRLLDLGATPEYEVGIDGQPIYFHLIAVAGAPALTSPRASSQEKSRLELLNRLIGYGIIDINQPAIDGATALMGASWFNRVDVVKALLHSGANVRAGRSDTESALMRALKAWNCLVPDKLKSRGDLLGTVQTLLKAMGETPTSRPADGVAASTDVNRSGTDDDDDDDDDIGNALVWLCRQGQEPVRDKLAVASLLLGYKRAVERANAKQNLVLKSFYAGSIDMADIILRNGFDPPSEEQIRRIEKNIKFYSAATQGWLRNTLLPLLPAPRPRPPTD
ncbi:hypothetical protein ONZ43_g1240 [Nemania bipapillata]|uniref:Uncharacterized protein n=1 Tax=Nemania bipapillata TaxID=110536 RepID=A0ACC2J612_9PEZI|nr:hypothetical protein ONZ43_g1240 [Nemania bipapillata]